SGQWYYRISFTDKSNSPWSLSNPGEYLSERALDRRERQGIIIDSLDLPLNPHYIEQVLKHEVSLINSSKWLNSIVIEFANNNLPEEIIQLPFVKEVQVVKKPSITKSS